MMATFFLIWLGIAIPCGVILFACLIAGARADALDDKLADKLAEMEGQS